MSETVTLNPASGIPGLRLVDGTDMQNLANGVNNANSLIPANVSVILSAAGAIPNNVTQIVFLEAGTAAAMTLANPPTGTGESESSPVTIQIISLDAFAYTVTCNSGKLASGAAGNTTATFAAHAGASLTLHSVGLSSPPISSLDKWFVTSANGITFS